MATATAAHHGEQQPLRDAEQQLHQVYDQANRAASLLTNLGAPASLGQLAARLTEAVPGPDHIGRMEMDWSEQLMRVGGDEDELLDLVDFIDSIDDVPEPPVEEHRQPPVVSAPS